ncbi:MAG: mechanosensitive ion channel domain-containing protein [Leptolyngbyaceae cyanobacterium]
MKPKPIASRLHRLKHRPRSWLRWSRLLLALCALFWVLGAQPVLSQSASLKPRGTASVVVDGRVVFEVHGTENLTAIQRAAIINELLQEEVERSEPLVDIRVINRQSDESSSLQGQPTGESTRKERPNGEIDECINQICLKSRQSNDVLVTVTRADVERPGSPLIQQANIWRRELQEAIRRGQRERTPSYLRQAMLYCIVVLLVVILLQFVLQTVRRWGTRYLTRQFNTATFITDWKEPIKVFWQLAFIGLQVGSWLTVLYYITDLFPRARQWRYIIFNSLTAEFIALGDSRYSALQLMLLVGATVGLWFAANAIAKLFRLYVLSRARVDQRLQDILSVLVQYALIFVGVIVLLQIWGIDSSSLAILASVLGVGIGFGVQNITNNFISGFIITIERPIQVGDFINVGELVGTVKQVGARSTEIRTLDQVAIIVPNSRFLESEVINWSHGSPVSRLRVPVGVAYGSDIPLVKTALLEAIKRHPEVLLRPKPEIWFQGFGDSSLNFEVMVWTGEPRQQFRVKSDLNYEIEASLRRHGVEIPFPQRDLHLRSPELDDLVGLLKKQIAGESNGHVPDSYRIPSSYPETAAPEVTTAEITTPPTVPTQLETPEEPEPSWQPDEVFAELDLEALAEAMQGSKGITLHDHHYQSEVYPDTFTGTAAVEWLVQHRDYTREGAIHLGQWLLQKGLIQGVLESDFRDGYYFYRFYQEQPADLEETDLPRAEPTPTAGEETHI